ncbi:hypothetical protein Goari_023831, partial [Gossypium aridum]|nr:hypothetical protein [Gossypium aridum]
MRLPIDMVKARLQDKNGHCFSWSDIRDVMGKASGDRHLSLFVFAVYGLIVFTKAVGYVSVKLDDFLFQTKKGVNPAPAVLAKTIISLNFIKRKGDELFLPIKKFLDSEWPSNQLIEEWVQNL